MKEYDFVRVLGDIDYGGWQHRFVLCPVCGYDYNHVESIEEIPGNDKGDAWSGRGDLVVIRFSGECDHAWSMFIGFHKGNCFIWAEGDEMPVSYYEYIQSPEWKIKAADAKERAGWRCQVCNRHRNEVVLDAHHRTYERLGRELDEDLTVLCRDCHSLYEQNKRNGAS